MRLFSAAGELSADAGKSAGRRPTQYGQTKLNFNGPTYRTTRGAGRAAAMVEQNTWFDFTANTLWDNPGARRIAKRVGRGQGSGKGKTCGRGHKGTYARSGGKINRGFEGGQSAMSLRFPKRGFRSRRFNNDDHLEPLNLGRLAYFIEKGDLNASEPITMKLLFEKGVVTKIKNGVKILGRGSERIRSLGVPIHLEASDATRGAIDSVAATGGQISVKYRTPLIMRNYLKPHKFPEYVSLKTPMPPPKKVKKLEQLRAKGLDVEYPAAPWFTDNKEALEKERLDRERRLAEAQYAELLPQLPADRSPGVNKDRIRYERKALWRVSKTT